MCIIEQGLRLELGQFGLTSESGAYSTTLINCAKFWKKQIEYYILFQGNYLNFLLGDGVFTFCCFKTEELIKQTRDLHGKMFMNLFLVLFSGLSPSFLL